MKKLLVLAVATLALVGMASSSFALLCATDQVPAATLLFPYVTAKYAGAATETNPVADKTAAQTLFAVTNVSSSPKIVHFVLYNDMSYPLLDWDILLTGYDVITYNFADIIEGTLQPTGGTTYSPTGTQPIAQGPVPSFIAGVPNLPVPGGVGATKNTTTTLYGLCTNPTYTTPFTIDPTYWAANKIPAFNLARVFNGLRKSQWISENGFWGSFPPAYVTPNWLLARSTADNIWAYITADVVDACGLGFPGDGAPYFTTYARPMVSAYYANGINANTFVVDLGNVLIGDQMVVDPGNNGANGGPAVHIEVDNQPQAAPLTDGGWNDTIGGDYPKQLVDGETFYRYSDPLCNPSPTPDDIILCTDYYTGTGIGEDYVTGATYIFGSPNGAAGTPTGDFREPLPSAFAFRWMEGGAFDGGTQIRVWKEFSDLYPLYGFTYIYSPLQYSYYAWDEQERVLTVTTECPVSPCPNTTPEINQLPLELQSVSSTEFLLPRTQMTFGWTLFAFMGSNYVLLGVPGGYGAPFPNVYGTQAWMEVEYTASGKYSVDMTAAVLGNYLCDGLSVASVPQDGIDVTDLGDVLY